RAHIVAFRASDANDAQRRASTRFYALLRASTRWDTPLGLHHYVQTRTNHRKQPRHTAFISTRQALRTGWLARKKNRSNPGIEKKFPGRRVTRSDPICGELG